jgi:hypothetical protein
MKYITVNTTLDDATNIKAYAVCFEAGGSETHEEIQTLVYTNRAQPAGKYSVVEMTNVLNNDYTCNLLQKYESVGNTTPVNIVDGSQTVYVVTIGNDNSAALNGTMKTTTVIP